MGCDCFGDDVGRRERERFEFGSRLGWSLSLALPAQVRLYERWTRDGESFTRDHECLLCWAGCLKQDLWDFQDGGGPAGMGALVQVMDERLREFTSACGKFSEYARRATGR